MFFLFPVLLLGLFIGYYFGLRQAPRCKQEIKEKTINNSIEKDKQQIVYFAKVKQISTSGDIRFYWYDTEFEQVKDIDNEYAWFWAMPVDVPDDLESTDGWVGFIRDNSNSVFKITGTRGQDDCDYYGPDHCIEDVNIDRIEIVGQKLPDIETAGWQGKITDWLGRTFDINEPGKDSGGKDLKMVSQTAWTISGDPFTIEEGSLEKVIMGDGLGWDTYPKAKEILGEANLSALQKRYFYDHNYVPRSVEHYDVTGDGIAETVVTSLTLGCGRCVGFYMTIFTTKGKYNMGTNQGAIIKAEDGNGFYLINDDWGPAKIFVGINRYKWDGTLFREEAEKEMVLEPK